LFGQKKIHMFNEGGEIDLFRRVGLAPVFFGEALVGSLLPHLTYMVTFEDMEAHDKNWKAFIDSPEWKELKENPYYKDTVSNITKIFLRAADCSDI
ncbi:MAG: NIPSNAP family protein, partial [Candidatus Omnitrophica bacterium]|nr:NIPSNAP family protein [Candidatus Omnitrophota bacterium]